MVQLSHANLSSYGPINKNLHYYTPRTELVDQITAHTRGNANNPQTA